MAFRIGFCTCLICSSVIYLSYQFHRGPLPNFSWHSVRTPQTLDSMDLTIESFPVFTAQVLGFLVRFRSALENPSKDSTDYVVANQSALHAAKQFSKALRDAYRKAESASVAAKKRSDEIENIYRQARRLVRTKAQACEAQSRAPSSIRTGKHRICASNGEMPRGRMRSGWFAIRKHMTKCPSFTITRWIFRMLVALYAEIEEMGGCAVGDFGQHTLSTGMGDE